MTIGTVISTMGVLLFIIALIWGISWLALRFQIVPGQKNQKGKGKTTGLLIVETLTLDTKRRLVKVEDNGMEHLLLLGPTTETHIHSKKMTTPSELKTTLEHEAKELEAELKQSFTQDKAVH